MGQLSGACIIEQSSTCFVGACSRHPQCFQAELRKQHHLLRYIRYLIVRSWWNCCRFAHPPAAQAARKRSPDSLTVTGTSAQALPTWVPRHELAHDEYHARDSQEEPVVNRTAEGNAGDEPRLQETIQEEVAEPEQSRGSLGKWRQSLQEPVAVHEQRRARAAEGASCERAKQRHQAGSHESQADERLARLNKVAEERGIGHHQSLQDGSEEAGQVTTTDYRVQQPTELGREHAEQELISTSEQPLVADEELEASERNVRGSSASGPGVLSHGAQAGSFWKMDMRSVLNFWCSRLSLEVRFRLSDHRYLLSPVGARHRSEP